MCTIELKLDPALNREKLLREIDELSFLRDFLTFLEYTAAHKVNLTGGYIGKKHVHAINDRLLKTIINESKIIEEKRHPLIFFFDYAARSLDLVKERKNLLVPTDRIGKFLSFSKFNQLANITMHWWNKLNWVYLVRFPAFSRQIHDRKHIITEIISSYKCGQEVSFKDFDCRVAERLGIDYHALEKDYLHLMFDEELDTIVMKPLEWFGAIRNRAEKKMLIPAMEIIGSFEKNQLGEVIVAIMTVGEEQKKESLLNNFCITNLP
jgi:hypothetical protein